MRLKFRLFFICFIICCSIVRGQKHLLTIKHDQKQPKETYIIENTKNDQFGIFLDDKNTVSGYFFDSKFSQLEKLIAQKPSKKYSEYIGYATDSESISLFFKKRTKNKTSIARLTFNTISRKSYINEFEGALSNSNYLTSHTSGESFFVLGIIKESSSLRLLEFSPEGQMKSFKVSTYSDELENNWLLKNAGNIAPNFKPIIIKVDPRFPYKFGGIIKPYKSYVVKNGFSITLNNSEEATYILEINTSNKMAHVLKFENPKIKNARRVTSNSFICDNKLFQITTSKNSLKLIITDLIQGGEIRFTKEWSREELFDQKNSKIRGDDINQFTQKTNQNLNFLLSLMAQNKSGLYVQEIKDRFIVTIGGYFSLSGLSESNGFMINFDLVFDENLNHLDLKSPRNVFEKVSDLKKKIAIPRANIISSLNGEYVFGNYNLGNHFYYLFEVNELDN